MFNLSPWEQDQFYKKNVKYFPKLF